MLDGIDVENDPVNAIDPLGLFNPSKGFSSAGNAVNAGRLYATGTLKLLAAGGMTGTGVAAPAGVGTAALGTWNLTSAGKAWDRSVQQWNEALGQNWNDATWINLLGMLPYGSEFDDPCEPTAWEFLKEKAKEYKNKPGELLRELGTMGF